MFFKYIPAIWANCNILIVLQFVFAPASINKNLPSKAGNIAARAGLSIPFILPTNKVAPANNAPEFPADKNTSPSPFLSILNPTTIDEFFFVFIAFVGLSSIVISSSALTIFILSDNSFIFSLPYNSFIRSFNIFSFPIKIISALIFSIAFTAPVIFASGALSPPIASNNIFIISSIHTVYIIHLFYYFK